MQSLSGIKDRSHYGLLVRDVVMDVTPEQARVWLHTRPPAPIMWSRGSATNEKARRLADVMASGAWDNDRGVDPVTGLPVEPVMISEDHGYILGGHHRLTAVSLLDHPLELRVLFWSKPEGWDKRPAEERRALQQPTAICDVCGWWSQDAEVFAAHRARAQHGGAVE